jgi:hypothetical protein
MVRASRFSAGVTGRLPAGGVPARCARSRLVMVGILVANVPQCAAPMRMICMRHAYGPTRAADVRICRIAEAGASYGCALEWVSSNHCRALN